jgi:hypothetical protein
MKAPEPPSGEQWLHEIKHDGFRMLVRRDAAGVRLFTRNGHDWTGRFPLIVRGALSLKAASCLIDGEAVCCDDNGVSNFNRIRYRRHDGDVFLYAFDLIEFDGDDLRREPIERRKVLLFAEGPNNGRRPGRGKTLGNRQARQRPRRPGGSNEASASYRGSRPLAALVGVQRRLRC